MICPHCHCENRDGAKFCNECGTRLSESAFESTTPALQEVSVADEVEAPDQPEDFTDGADATETESDGQHPQASGPLDLPSIAVEGVNVDEDGNEFDFADMDIEDVQDDESVTEDDVAAAAEDALSDNQEVAEVVEPIDPDKTAKVAPVNPSVDLTGIDECLVDAGYVPPQASWRNGDTMQMPRIDGEAAPKQKEFRAPDANAKKRGKGKIVAVVLAVLLVAAAGTAAVTYYLELWGGKTLPDVVGLTQADAQYALESQGFTVRAMQVKSDETEGVVLLSDPSAGARQETGTEVVIHVAIARSVPDVVGKQRDEALALLANEGLDNVTVHEQKSDEAEGLVLAVTPDAGVKAKSTAAVTITVAVPYTVPDVAGLSWDEASAAISDAGFSAQASYEYSESVAAGTVLRTEPVSGEKLTSGSTVTVVVALSRASELEEAARAYLQSAGSVSIGGTTYEIASVDAVHYEGGDQTSFTITGAAVTTLDGETVRGSTRQRSGTITWNSANEIVSIA